MSARAEGAQPLPEHWVVLLPVFNDWEAARLLIEKLDEVAGAVGLRAEILIVDDASTKRPGPWFRDPDLATLEGVRILPLRRNLNHQRAIAVGLSWIADYCECTGVVIMDSDGEDDPEYVPQLIEASRAEGHSSVVFGARARRSESLSFRLFYRLYQAVHWILTGLRVRVGNFSVLPRRPLLRVVSVSEAWNHYAAAVFKARIESVLVPVPRAARLAGFSHMNFTSLVVHGLSALSVYSPRVLVRLMVVTGLTVVAFGTLASLSLLGAHAGPLEIPTRFQVPIWASLAVAFVSELLLFCFTLSSLASRHVASFVPHRDYATYLAAGDPARATEFDPSRPSQRVPMVNPEA